jgi:hypothetical protein
MLAISFEQPASIVAYDIVLDDEERYGSDDHTIWVCVIFALLVSTALYWAFMCGYNADTTLNNRISLTLRR